MINRMNGLIGLGRGQGLYASLILDMLSASLDPRITFTRASTATRFNSSGLLKLMNTDVARFDYDPATLAPKGLLIEEARTQLFLNSLIDGTNLSTQSVSVTAQAYTISFYGTGSITLSGAATATINGTGAYPSRTTSTFTPSAGTLTCTVSGTVQFAQIEAGSFATSFIPSAGSTVTRAADVASMTGTNFSSWYNASEGTFLVEYDTLFANTSPNSAYLAGLDNSSSKRLLYVSSYSNQLSSYDGATIISTPNVATGASAQKGGFAYSAAGRAICANGGGVTTGTGSFSGTSLNIGHSSGNHSLNGHIRRLSYYPTCLSNAQLQSLTA